jgi:WD40 repeat protein
VIVDNNTFAVGDNGNTIKIWEYKNVYACLKVLKGHRGRVTALVFNQKKGLLISGSSDMYIKVWILIIMNALLQ